MLLTEAQLREVSQIIADHHSAFVVNTIGPGVVPPEVLKRLQDAGLVDARASFVEDAYLYGLVVDALGRDQARKMTLGDFRRYLRQNPVALTPSEQQAARMARQSEAKYVVGLGNRIDVATGQVLIEADARQRRALRATIATKTAEAIEARRTVKQLKSDLGHATKDWTRDLDRIAVTEKMNAMGQGAADAVAAKHGEDAVVFRRAAPDCCPQCARLLTGPDGAPKLFRLKELEANGTNVGRKAADLMAVVGAIHPNCGCGPTTPVPAGWGFDARGDLTPTGPYGKAEEGAPAPAPQGLRKGRRPALRRSLPALPATGLLAASTAPECPARGRPARLVMRNPEAALRKGTNALAVPGPSGDRNPSFSGMTGAGLLFNAPPLELPDLPPSMRRRPVRDAVELAAERPEGGALHRDQADYEQLKVAPPARRDVSQPEKFAGDLADQKQEVEDRRRQYDKMAERSTQQPLDANRVTPKRLVARLKRRRA